MTRRKRLNYSPKFKALVALKDDKTLADGADVPQMVGRWREAVLERVLMQAQLLEQQQLHIALLRELLEP